MRRVGARRTASLRGQVNVTGPNGAPPQGAPRSENKGKGKGLRCPAAFDVQTALSLGVPTFRIFGLHSPPFTGQRDGCRAGCSAASQNVDVSKRAGKGKDNFSGGGLPSELVVLSSLVTLVWSDISPCRVTGFFKQLFRTCSLKHHRRLYPPSQFFNIASSTSPSSLSAANSEQISSTLLPVSE